MKYAISTLMQKLAGTTVTSTHHLCVVEGVSKHECLGKAMEHAFASNNGYLIVGMQAECVEESDSTYEMNAAWGSFTTDGRWQPNLTIAMPADEQRRQNVANGHICAGCYRSPTRCVCLKPGDV